MNKVDSGAEIKVADSRLGAMLIEGQTVGEDVPLSPEFGSALKQDAAEILAESKRPTAR